MGGKIKKEEEKKVPFNLSITKKVIDELKEIEEYPSPVIESLVKKYIEEEKKKKDEGSC